MSEFEVTVSGEVDQDELIADVIYRGRGVADVRYVDEQWLITLYVPPGSDRRELPFQAFLRALEEAHERLAAVYGHR
jgi:hypothetical protein